MTTHRARISSIKHAANVLAAPADEYHKPVVHRYVPIAPCRCREGVRIKIKGESLKRLASTELCRRPARDRHLHPGRPLPTTPSARSTAPTDGTQSPWTSPKFPALDRACCLLPFSFAHA